MKTYIFTSFDRYLAIVANYLAANGIEATTYTPSEVKAAYEEGVLPTALASYFRDRYLESLEDFQLQA